MNQDSYPLLSQALNENPNANNSNKNAPQINQPPQQPANQSIPNMQNPQHYQQPNYQYNQNVYPYANQYYQYPQTNVIPVANNGNNQAYQNQNNEVENVQRMKILTLTVIIDCLLFIVINIILVKSVFFFVLIVMGIQACVFGIFLGMKCTKKKVENEEINTIRNTICGFIILYFVLGVILTAVDYYTNASSYYNDYYADALVYLLRTSIFAIPQFVIYFQTRQKKGFVVIS